MGHPPKIGRSMLSSSAEELLQSQPAESLGTISPEALKTITEDPPPPWETDPRYRLHDTDARRFVSVPDNWELRWLSPKLVQHIGMRDWQAVPANHSLVTIHNRSMVAPDNTVRKGGHEGAVLCWMYKSWVESRNRLKAEKTQRATRAAQDRQQSVRDRMNRGDFGRYVSVESVKHPTHTIGDGRSMTD